MNNRLQQLCYAAVLFSTLLVGLFHAGIASATPAPMNMYSANQINAIFRPVQPQFDQELRSVLGDQEKVAELMGRYTKWAFEQAGYSLDETVQEFLSGQSGNPYEKAQFAQAVGISVIIQHVASQIDGFERGYLRSGALSPETIAIIVDGMKPDTSSRDWVLPTVDGWAYPEDAYRSEGKIRMEVSPYEPYEGDIWVGYVVLKNWGGNTYFVLGKRQDFEDQWLALFDKLVADDKRVVLQGEYRQYRAGGVDYTTVLVDRSKPVTLILPRPVVSYR